MVEVSLAQYASRHHISEQRARALAAQGRINARKVGSRWLVTDTTSQRITRRAGRSPHPETVWSSALALDQHTLDIGSLRGAPERRRGVKRFIDRLSRQQGDSSLQLIATWTANRGELHHVRAADPAGLAADQRVGRSGLAWGKSPVQAIEEIDVYVRASDWRDVRADHALVEVPQSRANARVRVVTVNVDLDRDVPALIAVADLLDVSSPRARVAASSIAAALLDSPVAGMGVAK